MIRFLILFLALCSSALAQGLSTRVSQVDAAAFPSIGVSLGVFSEDRHPVAGMTRDDFRLDEDGSEVVLVSVAVDGAPLSIGLVLDLSGSMKPALQGLKSAVLGFVRNLNPSDRVLLSTFSDRPRLREDLTTSHSAIQERVERLETEGATALYDAVEDVVSRLRRVSGRRLAVVFTDGRDQNAAGTAPQSVATASSAASSARRHHVPLWTIGLGNQIDRNLLEKLAAVTGGRFYSAAKVGDLRLAFGRVLSHVRLQYRLTYRSPKEQRDGTLRKLTVTSRVRGREGQGSGEYVAPGPDPLPATPITSGAGADDGLAPLSGAGSGRASIPEVHVPRVRPMPVVHVPTVRPLPQVQPAPRMEPAPRIQPAPELQPVPSAE